MSYRSIILLVVSVLNLVYQQGLIPGVVVTPAPIDVPGLHVLIVEESGDRNTVDKGQLSVLQTTLVKQEVVASGGEYRMYDANEPPVEEPWRTAMERPRTSLPWLIVSNPGKGGFEGPVPAGDGAIDATLKIIGGLK